MENNNWSEYSQHILSELKRLHDGQEIMSDKIERYNVTLVVNTASLMEHMRRTEILENDLKPIKRHVAMLDGGLKLLGVLALFIGMLAAILKIASN